jgi:hypothetical protein
MRASLMMRSPPAHDAHRLRFDELDAAPRCRRDRARRSAFGLRHDLLRDHQAVAGGERRALRPRRVEQQLGDLGAGADLTDPFDRPDAE